MRATRLRFGSFLVIVGGLACLLAAPRAGAAPPRTYQGKPLSAWMDALSSDLDPNYRRAARDAVAQFGAEAVPGLVAILDRNAGPEPVALATGALVRLGPAGRAIVGRRLANGLNPKDTRARALLFPMIQGIGESGPLVKGFVSHMRSLANVPEVSLLALRVLTQAESAAALAQGAEGAAAQETADVTVTGAGIRLTLRPYDCFVVDRFSSIRFHIRADPGVVIRGAEVIFHNALGADSWLALDASMTDGAEPGAVSYEGIMPKPLLEATAISYRVFVRTNQGSVATDVMLGGLSPSEEGCALVGGRAAPAGSPKGLISVYRWKP